MKKLIKSIFDVIFIDESNTDMFENILDYISNKNIRKDGSFPDSYKKSYSNKYCPMVVINNDDFECSFFILFKNMEEYEFIKSMKDIFQDDDNRLEIINISNIDDTYDNW